MTKLPKIKKEIYCSDHLYFTRCPNCERLAEQYMTPQAIIAKKKRASIVERFMRKMGLKKI